ncbi:MAG: serine/threonine-protein kinase [Chitinivibrionales bacterium]|nr:serine/threonine-protein kinase [Chitinivibrionales bacterium]
MNFKKIAVPILATIILWGIIGMDHSVRLLENVFYDFNFMLMHAKPDSTVAIVGVDPQSIAAIGPWPWPRATIARLVRALDGYNPKAVAIDILFPAKPGDPENDSLSAALGTTPGLVLPFRATAVAAKSGAAENLAIIPAAIMPSRFSALTGKQQLDQINFFSAQEIMASDPEFQRRAVRSGFVNVTVSKTNQGLREIVHVIRAGEEYFPSFSLSAVAAFKGTAAERFVLDGKPAVLVDSLYLPLTRYAGTARLHFRGPAGTIATVAAVDVLNGRAGRQLFENKLVFIGITDPTAGSDFFTVPVGAQFPGVELWATASLDILENSPVKTGGLPAIVNICLVFLLFPGLVFFIPSGKKIFAALGGVAIVALSIVTGIFLFKDGLYFWNPAPHIYAWAFSIMWLALQKNTTLFISMPELELESAAAPGSETPPPPVGDAFIRALPSTTTAVYIADMLGGKTAAAAPGGSSAMASLTLTQTLPLDGSEAPPKPAGPVSETTLDKIKHLGGGLIVRELGSGGMADVYLVWNPRLESYRAVKVLKPDKKSVLVERFETEIRIFSKFNHPNIVRFYDVGEWFTLPFVEMEYVNGVSLDRCLAAQGALSVAETTVVGILICRALHHAHSLTATLYGATYNGIIHRDLKPGNILLSKGGRIKLSDFGISRPESVGLHTQATTLVGTLPYLAPEQLTGGKLSPRTDIYSLGVSLFELASGVRAFNQADLGTLVRAKCDGTAAPLKCPRADTAEAHVQKFGAILSRAMAVKPEERFGSALDMARELEHLVRAIAPAKSGSILTGLAHRTFPG